MMGGMRSRAWVYLLGLGAASACGLDALGVGGGIDGGDGIDGEEPTSGDGGLAESSIGKADGDKSDGAPPLDGALDGSSGSDTLSAPDTSCPPQCTSCAGGTCEIDCMDAGACPGLVDCPSDMDCVVKCMGQHACAGGVDCTRPLATSPSCTITCGTPGACGASDGGVAPITCATDGNCTVRCTGPAACDSVSCNYRAIGTCDIGCAGPAACGQAQCKPIVLGCSQSCVDGGCGVGLCCKGGFGASCTLGNTCH
jgi:hypothetical protein